MPARSDWDGDMTVYRYGVPSWADLGEEGMRQLRLAHHLRNELVAIHHRYEEMVQATWRLYPQILEGETAVEEAQAEVDRLREQAADERSKDQTTRPRADTDQALKDARGRLRAAKATRKEAKDRLYPEAKQRLLDVRRARDAARKALYADFVQTRGLYWATFNDVLDHHKTAVQRVADERKQGRPAELRFKRWDGSGTLCVQLQRGEGKPARTFDLLSSGLGPWRNVVQFWPESRDRPRPGGTGAEKHWEMRLTVGSTRPAVQLPVVLDRRPDPDADIALVRVTRERVASRHRLSVSVTCRIPAPEAAVGALACMHMGWRSLPDGDVRVAVITADRPLAAPADDLPIRRVEHGWEVRLPELLRHAHQRTEKLRSTRDHALDVLRADLAAWLDEHPQPDPGRDDGEMLTGERVRRWSSPGRFAQIASAWASQPPDEDGGMQTAAQLEAWRRQDRHLWEIEANERDQHTARIRDMWNKVAAWLTDQAGMVVVDDTNIASLTRAPDVGFEDSAQAQASRAQRQTASPGELRARVKRAARTRGVAAESLSPPRMTGVHCGCGEGLVGDPAEQIVLWCPSCGHGVDQDLNAAEHLLAAASAPADDDQPGTAR